VVNLKVVGLAPGLKYHWSVKKLMKNEKKSYLALAPEVAKRVVGRRLISVQRRLLQKKSFIFGFISHSVSPHLTDYRCYKKVIMKIGFLSKVPPTQQGCQIFPSPNIPKRKKYSK
jgi:hypothetical protein